MDTKFKKVVSTILLGTIFTYTLPVLAYTKEESVYSKLDANGKAYQTIVSDHLKNTEKESVLQDLSDLMNIENVSGDQELKQENNTLTWQAEGEDIYYEGKTEKQLPIECQVIYELDGEEVSKEEIVGKSGNVKITLHFTNHEEREVTINGKRQTMYVPFVVAIGTIIDNESNKNITVTNGKIMDDGTKTMVFGVAMPGMQKSLAISESQFEIPESVEISMEAKDFESNAIYIFATPKVFEEKDLDVFDKLDGLYAKMNTLSTSMNQIEEGANNASTSYAQINNGINSIKENSTLLNNGAKAASEGADLIATKLEEVSESVALLKQGGEKLAQGEILAYNGLDEMIKKLEQVTGTDNKAKIAELEKLQKNNTNTITALTDANTALKTSLKNIPDEPENSTQIETINKQIENNTSLIKLLTANNEAIQQTIDTLKATDLSSMEELQKGLIRVQNGVVELQNGTTELNGGLSELNKGVAILAEKSVELANGAKTLYGGTTQLQSGAKQLSSGSAQMKQGLNTLSDGITKLNNEGIKVLSNTINGKVRNVQLRVEKMQQLSNEYKAFTMAEENTEGNVKFIMMIDSLKKEDIVKEQVILPDSEKKEEQE